MRRRVTSYEYVIDSYAWIEYFRGTEKGAIAKPYIESENAATSVITLSELKEKYLREDWNYFDDDLEFISSKTLIVPIDKTIAVAAGKINYTRKKEVRDRSISDSLILSTAQVASTKVVTGDKYLKGLEETLLLE